MVRINPKFRSSRPKPVCKSPPRLASTATQPTPVPPTGWWEEAFTLKPNASDLSGHRCGQHQMLSLIAYDITEPKRLQKIAKICEDWGVRVQYSVFECRLEAAAFDRFWEELRSQVDETTDRLVAYKICLNCARDIRSAGKMVNSEKVVAYVC